MKSIVKYKILDIDKFYENLAVYVDLGVDQGDFLFNPWPTKSDYFGKLQFGKFVIYQQHKRFFQRRIVLKIEGEMKEDTLSLVISYYQYWMVFISSLLGGIFCLMLMVNLEFYIGGYYGSKSATEFGVNSAR